MAAQNELLAEAILEDKLVIVVIMLFQQLVYKLATSLLRTYLVDKLLEQHCHNLLSSLLQARCEHILLTSCWNSITTTSLSSKIASASNTFCAAILDVYFRILRCAVTTIRKILARETEIIKHVRYLP